MSGYGAVDAVDTNEPQAETETRNFRESTMYYLKEKPATREECMRKTLLVAFPILIAALVLGLFTSWILHGSGILKQGGHGARGSDFRPVTSYTAPSVPASVPEAAPLVPAPAPKSSTSKSAPKQSTGGKSSCSANSACADLGLTGECCPTNAGIMLGCCS
jgi:hypothetical protein